MRTVGDPPRRDAGAPDGTRPDGRSNRKAASRRLMVGYRVMAFTTAVLLIVLVFVGIPLQVAAGQPQVVNVVGTMHGFLYIVYLVMAFALTWRLRVPKGKTLLVLLAGTVPFCAFVAERKMTRRFEAALGATPATAGVERERHPGGERAAEIRRRWLSPRALVLHAEVLVLAPACLVAGWWQATQALAGNELSWVYSVEWPIFALLAVWGWWHLVHEDPEAYRARRWRKDARRTGGTPGSHQGSPANGSVPPVEGEAPVEVEAEAARWAAALGIAVWFEFALGWLTLAVVPFGRPSGWLPARGVAAYGVHASVGLAVAVGASAYLVRVRTFGRTARIVGWTGAVSLAVAGVGGLMTGVASLDRVFGVFLMFAGAALAGAAYLVPVAVHRRSRPGAGTTTQEVGGSVTSGAAPGIGPADAR